MSYIAVKPEVEELIDARDWTALREALVDWPAAEISNLLMSLDSVERVVVFRALARRKAAEVFSWMDRDQQEALLYNLQEDDTRKLLANLAPDDRTQLLEELPASVTQRMLNLLSKEDLAEARELLGYPEESVGRLMTPDVVAIQPSWTVGEALTHIRKQGKDSETLNVIYVVNDDGSLVDDFRVRQLLLADPETNVRDLMDEAFVALQASADQEDAIQVFRDYDRVALPVTDSEGVLLGIVTVDDVLDVAREEATEDFHKGAAVSPLRQGYRESSIWSLFGSRVGWLSILILVNLVSSGVIAAYEETLEAAIALAFFIPLLIDSGGNAGAQSATLMVRAIATKNVEMSQWAKAFGKEISVGLLLGVVMGLLSAVLGIFRGGPEIGLIVGLAMVGIILVANLVGTILPFILTYFDLDPAVASAPLITTIADAAGLLIYFSIAAAVLGSI